MTELLKNIMQLSAFFAMVFAAYMFMESRHAASEIELELQKQILELDIKKDAEARAYYFSKKVQNGDLDGADVNRLNNLERNLDEKYRKVELVQRQLLERKSD